MKNIITVLTLACAALLLTQCKKEIIENTGGMPSGEMIDVSLIAQNGDGTKTDIQGLNVLWELGDTLCVVGASDGMLGYISAQNVGTTAYFSGSINKSKTSNQVFHFYYVGKKANKKFPIGITEYTYNISNQTGSIDDIEDNLHLMHGFGSKTINPGDIDLGSITMKNMMSIVDVSFSRTDGRTLTDTVRCKCGFSSMKFDPKKGIFDNNGDAVEGVVRTSGEITLKNITTSKGAVANYYMTVIPGTQTFEFIQGVSGKRFTHDFAVNLIYNHKDIEMDRLPYIPSEFTINSNGDKVMFASGNLQWTSTGTHKVADNGTGDGTCPGTWRFAENQWDYVGNSTYGNVYDKDNVKCDNTKIAKDYTGWIDLFGYGTSGYDSKYPYQSSKTYADYFLGNLTGTNANYDWGVYNAISNGGNAPGMWRTLKRNEDTTDPIVDNDWYYVLFKRSTNSNNTSVIPKNKRYIVVKVNGIGGLLLIPDVIKVPKLSENITLSPGSWGAVTNIKLADFILLEEAGVVFLPAAGNRNGKVVQIGDSYNNYYWSSCYKGKENNDYKSYDIYFKDPTSVQCSQDICHGGRSVRLVKDVVNGGTASANGLESDTW